MYITFSQDARQLGFGGPAPRLTLSLVAQARGWHRMLLVIFLAALSHAKVISLLVVDRATLQVFQLVRPAICVRVFVGKRWPVVQRTRFLRQFFSLSVTIREDVESHLAGY